MQNNPTITVLGSGHSGHALAASFASKGYSVTLVSMNRQRLGKVCLKSRVSIQLTENNRTNNYPIKYSSDVKVAMRHADIVFCTLPATYHAKVVDEMLPFVQSGQYLYFSSYFGAMRMLAALRSQPQLRDVTVVESMSAIHASRSHEYGSVEILATKDEVPIATYPSYKASQFIDAVSAALSNLSIANSILSTSMNNVGPILHVPLMLFSAARIDANQGNSWSLYHDGLTDAVMRFIKELDQERLAIAKKMDVHAYPLEEIMLNIFYKNQTGGATDFWHWIRHNDIHASKTIGAPQALNTRYLTEGVYYGLVPLRELAKQFSVAAPLVSATIELSDRLLSGHETPNVEENSHLRAGLVCEIKSIARAA